MDHIFALSDLVPRECSFDKKQYADSRGYQEFLHKSQQNDVRMHHCFTSILVPKTCIAAFEDWIDHAWCVGGLDREATSRIRIESTGTGRGMVGSIRRLPGGVREQITSIGKPSASPLQIASVCYKMLSGPLFISEYIAFVHFVPVRVKPHQTLVVWECIYRPTSWGYIFCCGGYIIRWLLQYALETVSQEFREYEERAKNVPRRRSRGNSFDQDEKKVK